MNTHRLSLLFVALAAALAAPSALAGEGANLLVVTVTDDDVKAGDGHCSLREAVQNANSNTQFSAELGECPAGSSIMTDVIVLESDATYTLSLPGDGENIGDLEAYDTPGLDPSVPDLRFQTTEQGKATISQAAPIQRVMTVDTEVRIEIDNIVLRDGNAGMEQTGGAIYGKNAHILMTRSMVVANTANRGGGIALIDSHIELDNSQVLFNSATLAGGGIDLTESSAILHGALIQNNEAPDGGGANIFDSDLQILSDSTFNQNTALANDGGAILASYSSVLIRESALERNMAAYEGGAIEITGNTSTLSLENSIVADNEAREGGGVWSYGLPEPVHITGGRFSGNVARDQDGSLGAAAIATYSLILDGVRFENNFAEALTANAGAILVNRILAKQSEFVGNKSASYAGAILAIEVAQIDQCRFVSNSASSRGGGIVLDVFASETPSWIRQSTFSANTAGGDGGALWLRTQSGMHIFNTTMSGNASAGAGSALYLAAGGNGLATNVTFVGESTAPLVAKLGELRIENSILQSPGNDCSVSADEPFFVSLGHNISDDSSCFGLDKIGDMMLVDAMLAPLADNGGTTQTHALLAGSPAIDAGNGIVCQASPVDGIDQRGVSRAAGLNCDIGAFEYTAAPPEELPAEIFADGFEL